MENKEYILGLLKHLASGLAEQFGEQCEVAVHDLTRGYEGTIVAIENGHITGRKTGDSASEIVLEALGDPKNAKDQRGYLTRTPDGRLLKSSSFCLRGPDGELLALFGVNLDITDLSHAATTLGKLTAVSRPTGPEMIFSNVNDLLDNLIQESCDHVGKPVALMTKDDKIKAIHYLESKGAFLIKKSGDRVSKFYDISKYTLYNYMDSGPLRKDTAELS